MVSEGSLYRRFCLATLLPKAAHSRGIWGHAPTRKLLLKIVTNHDTFQHLKQISGKQKYVLG